MIDVRCHDQRWLALVYEVANARECGLSIQVVDRHAEDIYLGAALGGTRLRRLIGFVFSG